MLAFSLLYFLLLYYLLYFSHCTWFILTITLFQPLNIILGQVKGHFFLVSFFMNHHVVLRCIYCITNILIFLYYLFFCGHQTSVAWDMLRVYIDFIDAQERHRYFVESYLGAYVLNFQTLMCSSIKFQRFRQRKEINRDRRDHE